MEYSVVIFNNNFNLEEATILSTIPKAQLRSDDVIRRRFRATEGNALDIAFQWTKQGVIGTARQFRAVVGDIVEQEVSRIADEMNREAAGEIDHHEQKQ
jgi:hypothetical protein